MFRMRPKAFFAPVLLLGSWFILGGGPLTPTPPALAVTQSLQKAPEGKFGDRSTGYSTREVESLGPRSSKLGLQSDVSTPKGFVPQEVLIGFEPGADWDARADALGAVQGWVIEKLSIPGVRLIRIPSEPNGREAVLDAVAQLKETDGVRFAQPNFYRQAESTPSDSSFSSLWGLQNSGQSGGTSDADIDAPEAWDIETGSSNVTVAIVDGGVSLNHPDLSGNLWQNPSETANGSDDDGNGKVDDINGWDFVDSDKSPNDLDGHGTHVAGTVGAVGNNGQGVSGVAWDVSLMAVRVLDEYGTGTDADIAAGFDYAAKEGAKIVNASLGGRSTFPAIAAAVSNNPNTLFVVAAGNDGTNNESTPTYPCNTSAANLVCVGASTDTDGLADYSNYGSSSVDLAAPGKSIYSTYRSISERVFLSQNFEGRFDGWLQGGYPQLWGTATRWKSDGSYSMGSSPGSYYWTNWDTYLLSPVTSIYGESCIFNFDAYVDLENGYDQLDFEISRDGGSTWQWISGWTGTGIAVPSYGVNAWSGSSNVRFRWQMVTDSWQAPYQWGSFVDKIYGSCLEGSNTYQFEDGTSMASPHVAGAAALLLSDSPSLSVSQLRSALLSTVDQKPAFSGKTVTGGRLNVAAALNSIPPETTISSGPSTLINTPNATFQFNSTRPGAILHCSMDGSSFAPCNSNSSQSYSGLTDGSHTFRVKAVNGSVEDSTPASSNFTVDTTAPETTITSSPSEGITVGPSVGLQIRFSSSESPARFQCKQGSASWTSCDSGSASPQGSVSGPLIFSVRALDQAGNVDPTPETRSFVVDATPPSLSVTKRPPAVSKLKQVTISFSTDVDAALACAGPRSAFSSCTSPMRFSTRRPGSYQLRIRATDPYGNSKTVPVNWRIR